MEYCMSCRVNRFSFPLRLYWIHQKTATMACIRQRAGLYPIIIFLIKSKEKTNNKLASITPHLEVLQSKSVSERL